MRGWHFFIACTVQITDIEDLHLWCRCVFKINIKLYLYVAHEVISNRQGVHGSQRNFSHLSFKRSEWVRGVKEQKNGRIQFGETVTYNFWLRIKSPSLVDREYHSKLANPSSPSLSLPQHIWCLVPCLKQYLINYIAIRKLIRMCLYTFCAPCCETCGILCSKIVIR